NLLQIPVRIRDLMEIRRGTRSIGLRPHGDAQNRQTFTEFYLFYYQQFQPNFYFCAVLPVL
ncbi:MAG: hypothetical protein K2K25_06460, partial [Muribaculaceae bacterium]|nr:hypothetical protein [Muribaculaceae bacterium]